MTWSGRSDAVEGDACPACGTALVLRPARPLPVVPQTAFAVSFVAFLVFAERAAAWRPAIVWWWSGLQVLLGIWLARERHRSRRQVLRCVRCG